MVSEPHIEGGRGITPGWVWLHMSAPPLQGGRGMQPNFHFCWPQARMGMASPEHLREWGGGEEEEEEGWRREEREFAASNLVTDGVILPHETREVRV